MSALSRTRTRRSFAAAGAGLAVVGLLSACGYGSKSDASSATTQAAASGSATGAKLSADTVRIGYFANLTHATPLIGIQNGQFQKDLGSTTIKTQIFNAGPSEVEALNSGAIDIAWIGPSPAINGYAKSDGAALKIISGATTGGAELVVNPAKIKSVADLKGKKIANQTGSSIGNIFVDQVGPANGLKKGDFQEVRMDVNNMMAALSSCC